MNFKMITLILSITYNICLDSNNHKKFYYYNKTIHTSYRHITLIMIGTCMSRVPPNLQVESSKC